ncbi:uncharacterized protein LAESUDRAFT_756189 [Laetiporus sulphureus 93-53]|uniref:Uncharacterized protein n=1 Tax=Laetiporus sulphureus 93-53 TaxID=1314785 RepID=A0A165G8G5_9APHY|nr:uncharacterized protein LAESUDRAFT_756189 [Laetiporus sulphureus 93-53]KZT09974.1 hypothetical protein LAESUDRAFT_756189 [Laetiporus sulphureus 93-53]
MSSSSAQLATATDIKMEATTIECASPEESPLASESNVEPLPVSSPPETAFLQDLLTNLKQVLQRPICMVHLVKDPVITEDIGEGILEVVDALMDTFAEIQHRVLTNEELMRSKVGKEASAIFTAVIYQCAGNMDPLGASTHADPVPAHIQSAITKGIEAGVRVVTVTIDACLSAIEAILTWSHPLLTPPGPLRVHIIFRGMRLAPNKVLLTFSHDSPDTLIRDALQAIRIILDLEPHAASLVPAGACTVVLP